MPPGNNWWWLSPIFHDIIISIIRKYVFIVLIFLKSKLKSKEFQFFKWPAKIEFDFQFPETRNKRNFVFFGEL